jgi:hypothetical protein
VNRLNAACQDYRDARRRMGSTRATRVPQFDASSLAVNHPIAIMPGGGLR